MDARERTPLDGPRRNGRLARCGHRAGLGGAGPPVRACGRCGSDGSRAAARRGGPDGRVRWRPGPDHPHAGVGQEAARGSPPEHAPSGADVDPRGRRDAPGRARLEGPADPALRDQPCPVAQGLGGL
eukprot:9511359-Alexandrium_andersonii.AAC.1